MSKNTPAGWTARELARQTGIPASTIAAWVKNELVTADEQGRGRGGHTIGALGLLEILSIYDLRRAGASTRMIRRAVTALRKQTGRQRPLAQLRLVVSGKDIHWKDVSELSNMTFSTLSQPGQRLMVFPLGETHEKVLKKLGVTEGLEEEVLRRNNTPNIRAKASQSAG